jgi:arylsulfatase A-like enzyme
MKNTRRNALKQLLSGTAILAGCSEERDNTDDNSNQSGSSSGKSSGTGAGLGAPFRLRMTTKGRNLLLIIVDEMRFPMHFPGDQSLPDSPENILSEATYLQRFMPNLWQVRSRAVSFANHHTAATACTPARASMLTGLYAHQHNLLVTLLPAQEQTGSFPMPVLAPEFPTVGTVVSALGYETMWIGKWHLSYPGSHDNSIGSYGAPDFGNLRHLYSNGYLSPYGFKGGTYPDPEGGAPSTGELLDPQICDGFAAWSATVRPALTKPWLTTVSLVQPHDANRAPSIKIIRRTSTNMLRKETYLSTTRVRQQT